MRSIWTSYTHQLWNGLKYGLGASSATIKELKEELGSSDYYLTSTLGVVQSIKNEWRYLPVAFCGMGLFDLRTETTATTLNKFLQHGIGCRDHSDHHHRKPTTRAWSHKMSPYE